MSIKEKILEFIIRPEGWYIRRYLRLLRSEESASGLVKYWYKARRNRLGVKLGFFISAGCFGPGLKIEHVGSVIVNPKARIGRDCIIHGNCCIGSKGGYPDDSPVIGNRVDIGQFAQIIGPVRIADGVRIGAGAVVVSDILEPGATVVGVPGRVVE